MKHKNYLKSESDDSSLYMFPCAWCKKKFNDAFEWSQDGEHLCSTCSEKYHFGVAQGMINKKVSQLSKLERQRITSKLKDSKSFKRARRVIKDTALRGKAKNFLSILGWILAFFPFLSMFFVETELTSALVFTITVVFSVFLYKVIEWLLKLFQIRKESKMV